MIKEIVDIGQVVDSLASVFTMQVDILDYVKVDIDHNLNVNIGVDAVSNKEEFLKAGLFREKSGNKIILFPSSFVMEIEKNQIKTKLDFFAHGMKLVKSDILEKIYKAIEINFSKIGDAALEVAGDVKNRKKIAVSVSFNDKLIYEYDNLFEKMKDAKISLYFQEYGEGVCNILGIKSRLYYPKTSFYYPFSVDKKIVKYDLKDEKNLFLISKEAIEYFFAGKEYLENFNRYKILKDWAFVSGSSFEIENLKKFERILIKDREKNFKSLVEVLDRAGSRLRENILVNFYFHTSPQQGSKEIISYIKDVMPTYLVQIEKNYEYLFKTFKDLFNTQYRHWSVILKDILEQEKEKRERIEIFGKIVLNKRIDIQRVLYLINQKSERDRFYLHFYLLLIWLKGGEVREINGRTYEERLEYVLNNFELIKESESAKAGVCIGLILKMLSFAINNFDKKVLAFVSKKLGRDKRSLIKFVNPIFERAKLHQKSRLVDVNIECAAEFIAKMEEFNKDEFIFGLFLGDEMYDILKGEEDEQKGGEDE